jgi:SagB-type dehydrogenase family enzyme
MTPRRSIPATAHAATMLVRGQGAPLAAAAAPRFKVYANPHERVCLPPLERTRGDSVWEALAGASGELAEGGSLDQDELGRVLWAAAGLIDRRRRTHLVPGEASGLEAYLIVHAVRELSPGRYHYDAREHTLEQLGSGDIRSELATALLDRRDLEDFAASLVLAGVPARLLDGHGARAYRLLALEAGAAAQAAVVAATALGLTGCLAAGFYDAELAGLLELDAALEPPLAVVLLGR